MNELKEKEAQAIKVLRTFEPEEGYVLAYSGGKDSDCIKILAQLAGVKFEAVHNLTTADAPVGIFAPLRLRGKPTVQMRIQPCGLYRLPYGGAQKTNRRT